MSRPDEEFVRRRLEEARLQREEAYEQSKARSRLFERWVLWLIALFFLAMTVWAVYSEYPMIQELIVGHREGWVPTSLLVVGAVLVIGMLVGAGILVVLAWRSRR